VPLKRKYPDYIADISTGQPLWKKGTVFGSGSLDRRKPASLPFPQGAIFRT
jgi:hypothetical protein